MSPSVLTTALAGATTLLLLSSQSTCAFVPPNLPRQMTTFVVGRSPPVSVLSAGGFGSSGNNKKKQEPNKKKLKPKAQWDRYCSFKKETAVRVAVKKAGEEEWLEVGNIKSKDSANTVFAVARQRALIAEHARRLFPLQISAKDQIEWAYNDDDEGGGNWIVVDKSVLNDAPDAIEKEVGFEGRPDPVTGFYDRATFALEKNLETSKKRA